MNFRNIIMWGLIVLLSVGLFNLFQNPNKAQLANNKIAFSKFLEEVDAGRVIQVEIQGNNIDGIMSDNSKFNTYSPNYPDLVEKLSSKNVNIIASPVEDKMPSLFGILLSWFPMLLLIGVWIFFMRQMQGGRGGAMGFGRSKAKLLTEAQGKVTFNDVAGIDEAKEEVEEAVALVARDRQASISYVQRRLRVGYNRAARIIETMERDGVVGPSDGIRPREIYVNPIPVE